MQKLIKRLIDILGASFLLIALCPILFLGGALVYWKLGTPIFFRQVRIGRNRKPFTLIKFRSMPSGQEPDSARLTPFGAKLRATSFDELPELWNVLKGDLSFIGPRPLLPEYLQYYTEREHRRHRMRPGITGLAQVYGRNAIPWNERLEKDVEYIENFSLGLDARIIMRTLFVVLKREGISAAGQVTMCRLDDERGLD